MVWMRSRPGSCASRQPRSCERASTAAASCRKRSACPPSAISPRSARSTRARISAAARRVKVIARISSGSSTTARRRSNRCVRTVVLPEPAGACRMTERSGSMARSRAKSSASAGSATSILEVSVIIDAPQPLLEGLIIGGDQTVTHAAYARDVAEIAGSRLRIHHRLSRGKGSGQPLHETMPFPDACLPRILRLSRWGLQTRHLRQQLLAHRDAVVSDLSRRNVDGRHRNDIVTHCRKVREKLLMRGPVPIPIGAHPPAALVVENGDAATLERIEAIDAQAQLLPRHPQARGILRMPHAEGCAFALDLEQLADEPRGAAAFPRQRRTGNRV